jgi:hypothetical protein
MERRENPSFNSVVKMMTRNDWESEAFEKFITTIPPVFFLRDSSRRDKLVNSLNVQM